MQSTILVFLAMAMAWLGINGHPGWMNFTFLVLLAVWIWDLADRLNKFDRKGMHGNERCDH